MGKDFDRRFADFQRQSDLSADQRYKEFVDQNKRDLQKIGNDLNKSKSDLKDLEKQIKEQEKVNQESNKKLGGIDAKLDSIIPTIAGIPIIVGKAADNVIKNIPTPGDIEKAAATGVCRSTQPGGCMRRALDDQSNTINNNTNNAANNILQGLDTAGTGALVAGQQEILGRLGSQIPGGLGRLITQITRNQAINQIANLVTMAAAIHNCIQLSDNVAVTFFGILDNIFAIPTLIINPEADTIDTREVFNGAIENVMKSVFGVEEWAEIKAKWAAFNRIYQAAANSVNEIRSIGSSLNDAISTTATLTGRGFNALQNDGILSDYNWEPTPENLRLKGGIYAKLGKLADGITIVGETLEAIESVTSEIRSAVESANQIKSNTIEMESEVKKLLGDETRKRDEAIEAIQAPTFNYEDLL
ncbi:hypothetical protein NIES4103_70310 (plasmid) [Nostoc sp. NIES-4103]|nr:hypothetical protein NIES4103_70310 [Nostoc sp. NIES-4103]